MNDLIRQYVRTTYNDLKNLSSDNINSDVETHFISKKYKCQESNENDINVYESSNLPECKKKVIFETEIDDNFYDRLKDYNFHDKKYTDDNIYKFPFDDEEAIKLSNIKPPSVNEIDIYDRSSINSQIYKLDLTHLESTLPYPGYDTLDNIKRVLTVSHSGFISEMINVIRNTKGLMSNEKIHSRNTAVYVIRIYCKNCGKLSKCKCINQEGCEVDLTTIEFDFIVANDVSHLDELK